MRGGRLVWTIHNARPHDVINLDGFREARQSLVKRTDAIHVHAPHARDHMISEYGADPSRIHVISHPSFLVSNEPHEITLARPMPDRSPTTIMFFGVIRGEKGAERIRDAAASLTKRAEGRSSAKRTEFVLAEANVKRRYLGGYGFSELVSFMGQNGFEILDFTRPIRPESDDCDVLFARYDSARFDF